MECVIHLFHGFLGNPRDLEFFAEFGETKGYDMKSFDPDTFCPKEDDFLVGYSMGGRVALRIAHRLGYKIKKIILLSSNPNALSPEEKEARLLWEEKMKGLMLKSSPKDFLEIWNNLGIFKHDKPISHISENDLRTWAHVFEKYRLSDQADYLSDLKTHPDKFSWIVGSLDEKYLQIAKTSGVNYHTINAGHRLYQKPEEIIKLIKEQNLL